MKDNRPVKPDSKNRNSLKEDETFVITSKNDRLLGKKKNFKIKPSRKS